MRITVDLDRSLLERAGRAFGTPTYREAITRALEEAVARADLRLLGLLRAQRRSGMDAAAPDPRGADYR